jgi:hypothetical protein
MQNHKYRVGEKVNFLTRMHVGAARGEYEVMRLLPAEAGERLYRIKSALERTERVVPEHQLSVVSGK